MRVMLLLVVGLLLTACNEVHHYKGPVEGERELVVYGTTDTGVFRPAIEDFNEQFPNVDVRYVELEASPLNDRFLAERASGAPSADLLLSSAMDQQVRLVNDGYATPHPSDNAQDVPRWAKWRNEAFGVTFEPVVMVFNRRLMKGREIPRTRYALLQSMRDDRTFWSGRIGTYDIATSGVGYMIAAQDVRNGGDLGALIEGLREANVRKYAKTSMILDDIENGTIVAGYNLLGSYANIRAEASPDLEVVYPEDYTLAVSRTIIIPRGAPNADVAHVFLEYLLSRRGQGILTEQSRLSAVRPEVAGKVGDLVRAGNSGGQLRPIPLGPGLLVYLDRQKRERFLALWGPATGEGEEPVSP